MFSIVLKNCFRLFFAVFILLSSSATATTTSGLAQNVWSGNVLYFTPLSLFVGLVACQSKTAYFHIPCLIAWTGTLSLPFRSTFFSQRLGSVALCLPTYCVWEREKEKKAFATMLLFFIALLFKPFRCHLQ